MMSLRTRKPPLLLSHSPQGLESFAVPSFDKDETTSSEASEVEAAAAAAVTATVGEV